MDGSMMLADERVEPRSRRNGVLISTPERVHTH
jgi:hypothetical protein